MVLVAAGCGNGNTADNRQATMACCSSGIEYEMKVRNADLVG